MEIWNPAFFLCLRRSYGHVVRETFRVERFPLLNYFDWKELAGRFLVGFIDT